MEWRHMGGIIRSLSSVIKKSGSPKGLGNEKKTAHSSSLPSSQQCSCGTVASEVLTTWPGLVWELPTHQRPGQSQTLLWGGGLVFGASLYFCLKVHNLSFFLKIFFRVFYKKSGGAVINERENVGLNLGAGVDCGIFGHMTNWGPWKLFSPRWKETLVPLNQDPSSKA